MQRIPMTVNGEKALREELTNLKTIERPKISQDIASARELGDLKENAEYHAAREQQSFVEGRINEIETKLSLAQVIDITTIPNTGKVIFSSTVTALNLEANQEVRYKIVGDDEADIKEQTLSVNSPIARALIGKEIGDIVAVKTPTGIIEYEIIEVNHI
jgi:transcription elongation factor GreA